MTVRGWTARAMRGRRAGRGLALWVLEVFLLALPRTALTQQIQQQKSSGGDAIEPAAAPETGQVVRVLDDATTGLRWLLLRDPGQPGGPGRLVIAGQSARPAAGKARAARAGKPLIGIGDRVVVERHTARVDAVLEAVALSRAAAGEPLTVRLQLGGRVLRAVARARGRAELLEEESGTP